MSFVARSWLCWLCHACRRSTRLSLRPVISSPSLSSSSRSRYSTAAAGRDNDRPFRMAVVGSGPAGFYTAYRVMSKIPSAKVDMFEALPVPFGLVRFGVAPDHPEVKNCQEKFEEVASSPNFTFVGNVSVGDPDGHFDGCTIALQSVLRHYDAVVLAYGASRDRRLGVPGEAELRGIYSAREFVGWYNGLPEYAGLAPDLTRGDEAVVLGQGNVALDVARMLLENVDVLRKSDITEAALETLSKSRIRRVHIVGRRGPMQAAFTIKEIRELMKLQGVGFHPVDMALLPDEISKLPRARRRLMEMMVKGSTAKVGSEETSASWSLDYCLSPAEFLGDANGHVRATVFDRTVLAAPFDPASSVSASGTGEKVEIPSAVAFRSIGYKSVGLPGFAEAGILFDERKGVIGNDGMGRVLQRREEGGGGGEGAESQILPLPGVYCAGWVKRGPTGVIASTMEDAFSTGDAIAADWSSGASFLAGDKSAAAAGWDGLQTEVDSRRNCRVITWDDWRKIDKAERERGLRLGKEREKFTTTSEMLSAVR